MGLTRSDLRLGLRQALRDTAAPPLWTDEVIDQCIDEAVAGHSLLFPQPRTVYAALAAGARAVVLYPVTDPGITALSATPTAAADLIAVQAVELPVGTPIPEAPAQSTDPAGSGSTHYRQGWRWRGHTIELRNPAAGAEVGTGTMRIDFLQTYNRPDDAGITWDGPNLDVPLLLLLAKRAAYQALAEWQVRAQGLAPATVDDSLANIHLDVSPILADLERQIATAIRLRQTRSIRSRSLDI